MSGLQRPDGAGSDRQTGTETPPAADRTESQKPWRWKPEYWERYWQRTPPASIDLAAAR